VLASQRNPSLWISTVQSVTLWFCKCNEMGKQEALQLTQMLILDTKSAFAPRSGFAATGDVRISLP